MDVLTLSRIQFAVATYFHFLFVPLTLGMSLLVAILQTQWLRTGDEDYLRATKFWGKLFLINFAIGLVTGLTLEFQFGTNWSRYSAYVGDIFGSLLAVEATVAFFLESTFIAVWVFGWNRVNKTIHTMAIWIVAIASNISAYWILVANAWMQHPVGYTIRNGRAELTDFMAVITQPFALLEYVHTVGSAWLLAGFFMLGVSAWHLLRRPDSGVFRKSFKVAAIWTLIFAVAEIGQGHMNAEILQHAQPTKLAAMESHWETEAEVPMYLIVWPDPKNERNAVEMLKVPNVISILAGYSPDTVVMGLKDVPPDERPNVWIAMFSFRAMVGLGMLFALLGVLAVLRRNDPGRWRWLLHVLVWTIPLPYIAIELGWSLAEFGRQPWIVYGLMKTADGVSPIHTSQVAVSLVGFVLLYSLLGLADFFLLFKFARKGPEPASSSAEEGGA